MAMTFKTNLLPDQDLVRELGSSTQKWKINGVTDPKLTDTVTTVTTSGSGNAITAISASNGAITATKGTTFLTSHQDISGKVNKSGDTMTGQLKTSFKSSVAMGSFHATSTTIPDLVEELRFSSGCNGSVSITTAYTSPTTNEDLPTGWYNFFYAPHRSGGVNGAESGDNCSYGTIILTGMTINSQCWRIRIASPGTIAEVRRILNSGDGSYVKKSGDTMTGSLTINKTGVIPIKIGPYGGNYGTAGNADIWYCGTNASQSGYIKDTVYIGNTGNQNLKAAKVYGAVWNDYAEMRKSNIVEPGRCVTEVGDGTMVLSTERLQRGCKITSDTYGFCIGQTKDCNTPIAVSGRVLVYLNESREEVLSHIGYPVCSGPNGTVSIMTDEEEEKYPSRIIGTISEVPTYEYWNGGTEEDPKPIKVNGRIWIYVK